jgi:hypothetical protein
LGQCRPWSISLDVGVTNFIITNICEGKKYKKFTKR